MRKTSLHQKQNKSHVNLVISILLVAVLGFMTVGFAAYNKILTFDGAVTLRPQGTIRITNVQYTGGQHSSANPTFTDRTVDFGLSFTTVNQQEATYTASFDITVRNDTFYDQVFAVPNFEPVVKDARGNVVDDAELSYVLDGIANGDTIAIDSEITFSVTFTFSPSSSGVFTVDPEMNVEFTNEQTGQMFARISGATTGNLRSPNVSAPFTITIINTFDYARDFTIELVNNGNFYAATANGGRVVSGNIAANATQDFTVYVRETDPNKEYSTDYERANLYVKSAGISDVNAGRITLLVDKKVVSTDTEAPTISNVSATQQTTEGNAMVTWDATDESTIENFTIQVYRVQNNNPTLVQTVTTGDDETSYTVTGLGDANYYFVIYGTDAHDNTASAAEISGASTGSGHASRSANTTLDWNFSITYDLGSGNNAVTSSNRATSIKYDETYSTTLLYGNNGHPTSPTITMNGRELSSSAYSYDASTGVLSIPNVTGDLNIYARRPTTCLIEGTRISLWQGGAKKIEDVKYDDLLKVWSYDLGQFVPAYPIWMEKQHQSESYRLSTFSDGSTLGTVGYHSVFSVDKGEFISVDSEDYYEGIRILKDTNGKLTPVTVEKIEIINRPVNYYNVVSTYYYNILANGALTADGMSIISNLYGFTADYRWPASRAQIMAQPGILYDYSLFRDTVPYYAFKGLRIQEAGVVRDYFPAKDLAPFLAEKLFGDDMLQPNTLRPSFATSGRYWMFTTSEDNLVNKAKYLVREGSTKTVPSGIWFNTSDGQSYRGGDRLEIWTSVHLIKLHD